MEIYKFICCLSLLGGLVEIVNSQSGGRPRCKELQGFSGRIKYRKRKTKAVFKCRKREQRYGPRILNCRQDGTWDGEMPVCIQSGCVPVDISQSAFLDMTEEYSGALVKFSCEGSYTLVGAKESYCDGNNWNNPIPICIAPHDLTECDFEKDLCGWTQDDTDQVDWTRLAGATPTGNTGPKFDHTLEDKGTGHYMVFEASNPTANGDQARLISPEYTADMSPMCFDFWYHSLGPDDAGHVGSLEVYVVGSSEFVDDLQPLFNVEGNQGDVWHRGEIDIDEMTEPYTIVIEATRKLSYISDIAVDDLRLYNCTVDATTMPPSTSSQPSKPHKTISTTQSSTQSTTPIPTKGSTVPAKLSTLSSTQMTSKMTINPSQESASKTGMSSTVITTHTSAPQSTTNTDATISTTSSKISTSTSNPSASSSSTAKMVSVDTESTTIFEPSSTSNQKSTTMTQSASMRSTSTTQLSTKRITGPTTKRPSTKITSTTKLSTKPSTFVSTSSQSTSTSVITSSASPDKTKTTTAQTSTTGSTKPQTPATTKPVTTKLTTNISTSSRSTAIPTESSTTTAATTPPTTPARTTQTLPSTTKTSESSSTLSSQSRLPTSKSVASPTATPKTQMSNSSGTGKTNITIGKPKPTTKTPPVSSQNTSLPSVTAKPASEHPADETLKPLMIGLGVGIVAGLIIIGVIAYVCVRRRKFYTRGYGDELKPITNAASTQSINNVQYYHDHDEEYEN